MAKKFWHQIVFYWPLLVTCLSLLGGGMSFAYGAYDKRVTRIEDTLATVAVMHEDIKWIKTHMGWRETDEP